jgi:hypothetical protein
MIKTVFTYLLLMVVFVSCKKENRADCFKSNGADVTETRYVSDFDSIEVFDKFDVTISKGSEHKVEVTAGKHILGNIKCSVKNRNLRIENNNKCNFVRGYKRKIKVHITTPDLKKLFNDGVGPVTFDEDFEQDTLFIRAENSGDTYVSGTFSVLNTSSHGNGDLYLNGSSSILNMYTKGTNYIRAQNFKARDYLFISTYSIGDVELNLEGLNQLDYYIWDDGNIYYKGAAKVVHNLSDGNAKGKAIKKD